MALCDSQGQFCRSGPWALPVWRSLTPTLDRTNSLFSVTYFQPQLFDLLKLGQVIGVRVSRKAFAKHVVDLAARLALQVATVQDLNRGRELLHDQIARLSWQTYVWIIPVGTHRLEHSIYPVSGYEDVIPESCLGTALLYREQLNSSNLTDQLYARLMVRTGLEWACHKAQHEGKPNGHNDMPGLDCTKVNALFPGLVPSAV
jgi:hypothetical protein